MSENGQLRGGIDLGGTKIEAIVVDADDQVLGQTGQPTPTDGGPAGVARQMVEAMSEAAEAAGVETASLQGIGVGSPGDVDAPPARSPTPATSRTGSAPFELGRGALEAARHPVHLGNDVQVATGAEFQLGAGKP